MRRLRQRTDELWLRQRQGPSIAVTLSVLGNCIPFENEGPTIQEYHDIQLREAL